MIFSNFESFENKLVEITIELENLMDMRQLKINIVFITNAKSTGGKGVEDTRFLSKMVVGRIMQVQVN